MPKVKMGENSHQKKHQQLLIIIFHKCYHFIHAYIFHDALQAFHSWINLESTHVMCSNNSKLGYNNC
jgi:hypothetical protein